VSLILEALRRSERERAARSGDSGGVVMTPRGPVAGHRGGGGGRPWLLGVALGAVVAAVAVGAWLLGGGSAPPAEPPTEAVAWEFSSTVIPVPPEPAVSPPPLVPSPKVLAAPIPAAEKAPPAESPPTVEPKPQRIETTEVVSLAAQLEPVEPELANLQAQLVTRPSTPAPTRKAETPAVPAKKEWMRFDELPFDFQDSVPALDLQVHFYARNPERRFVLVNGRRFRAGEELMNGLLLVSIEKDGLVLRWRGRRFLMPATRE